MRAGGNIEYLMKYIDFRLFNETLTGRGYVAFVGEMTVRYGFLKDAHNLPGLLKGCGLQNFT